MLWILIEVNAIIHDHDCVMDTNYTNIYRCLYRTYKYLTFHKDPAYQMSITVSKENRIIGTPFLDGTLTFRAQL